MQQYREHLRPFVIAATPLLSQVFSNTASAVASTSINGPQSNHPHILVEGANAIALDIDYGTYPFVTSSNTGLGGAFTGLAGLSPFAFTTPGSEIVGVVKAYTSRVGSGPFPTELCVDSPHELNRLDTAYGDALQSIGREFGVTTGRKRRCGWLDLVLVKYSCQVNCYTQLNLTKLDVLDTFDKIRVATAYRVGGADLDTFPADLDLMESGQMEIIYWTFEGWNMETTGCKEWKELPQRAREYVEFIERELGVLIKWIGTGPRREDMIVR